MKHGAIAMLFVALFPASLEASPDVQALVPPTAAAPAPAAVPAFPSVGSREQVRIQEPDPPLLSSTHASRDPEREDPEETEEEPADLATPAPRLLTDIAMVGGVTAAHSLVYPDVRRSLRGESSFRNVLRNFVDPIGRARQGWAEDDDSFATNFVAHPLSWGIMGLYLKERGYSNGSALLFTQLHSIAWEYVIEGLYQKPSGLDLVTNLTSASTTIFVLHTIAERAAEREEKGIHHRILAALNPLRPFRGAFRPDSDTGVRVAAAPAPRGVGLAVVIYP